MRKFTISDIHGCIKTFERLLEKIQFSRSDELYILGDLIDRGPDSKGVLDLVMQLQREDQNVFCLRGNHDQMMLDARNDLQQQRMWLLNGGRTTVEDFDVDVLFEIPHQYFQFMEDMPYYYEVDDYILVHEGFSFDMQDPFEEFHSMLWKRDWYDNINYHWLKKRTIIHGHTPIQKTDIELMYRNLNNNQYLNIDGGCVHKGKRAGLGYLVAYELRKKKLIFQENVDF